LAQYCTNKDVVLECILFLESLENYCQFVSVVRDAVIFENLDELVSGQGT